MRMQAPPSCGTRVKDTACLRKDVLADSGEPQEQTVDIERTRCNSSEHRATSPPENAGAGFPAPPLSLQELPPRPAVGGPREATPSSSALSLATATRTAWQGLSCGRRWSSGSPPWPSAQRSWSTQR